MRSALLKNMPPVNGLVKKEVSDAFNSDIIEVIHKNYPLAVDQVKKIAPTFKGRNRLQTAQNIWNFLKTNIKYVKDVPGSQMIKLPNRFLADGTGDCKSYSLFTGAILGALGIPFNFRYTAYIPGATIPTHVYVTTTDENGREIIIDAVYKAFNSQKPFTYKKDYKMDVYSLSGIEDEIFGLGDDDYIGAVISELSPAEIQQAYRGIQAIQYGGGVYGPESSADIAGLKKAVQKVTKAVKAPVKAIQKAQPVKSVVKAVQKAQPVKKAVKAVKAAQPVKKTVQAIKKVGQAAPKVALAPARGSYLILVRTNFRGFANRIIANKNNTALKNRWENLGGNFNELLKVAQEGSKKKSIFGPDDIGAVGVAAAVTSAAAIIAALAPIIGKGEDPSGNATPATSEKGAGLKNLIQKATPLFKKAQGSKLGARVQAGAQNFLQKSAGGGSANRSTSTSSSGGGSAITPTDASNVQDQNFQTEASGSAQGSNNTLLIGLGIAAVVAFALSN